MAAYGRDMQELGLTQSWLMAAGKQLIWQRFLQSKIRKRDKVLPAPDGDAGPAATSQVWVVSHILYVVLATLFITSNAVLRNATPHHATLYHTRPHHTTPCMLWVVIDLVDQ